MNVFNTSPQILSTKYNLNTNKMTIHTSENIFTFRWLLGKL